MDDAARGSELVEELSAQDRLLRQIASRRAKVGVIGLGYVGLPLALIAARAGFPVLGFDVDEASVEQINRGESYIRHIAADAIRSAIKDKRFEATADFRRLDEADAISSACRRRSTRHREPDLTLRRRHRAGDRRAPAARPARRARIDDLSGHDATRCCCRSSRPPGLQAGRDFFLAFSPEREDPGNPTFRHRHDPEGRRRRSTRRRSQLAAALYDALVVEVVPVSSPEAAEACKLLENTFRAVNIALVNELKVVYDAHGHRRLGGDRGGQDQAVRLHAVLSRPRPRRALHPDRSVLPHLEGARVRASRPASSSWPARSTRACRTTSSSASPRRSTGGSARACRRSAILLLGIAYKKNVDDMRESPSLKLIELIEERGGSVDYHDPFIEVMPPTREHPHFAGRRSVAAVAADDCVLRCRADRDRPRRHRLRCDHRPRAARHRHPQRLRPRRARQPQDRQGVTASAPTLVTGAAGFIGFAVARRLLELGRPVVGVDNFAPYYDRALKEARLRVLEAQPLFRFERLDLADVRRGEQAVRDAPARPGDPSRRPGRRSLLARKSRAPISTPISSAFANLLEACRHGGVEHLDLRFLELGLWRRTARCRSRCTTTSIIR